MNEPFLAIGTVINRRYMPTKIIGKGAMGIVYEAEDLHQERKRCAIKLLLDHRIHKPHYQKRLSAEIEMMKKLDHPNIVKIYDYGTLKHSKNNSFPPKEYQAPYLVMEFLSGTTLDVFIQKHELSLKQALNIIIQVLQALDYTHRQDIIHRDIKPENIFICKPFSSEQSFKVKLLDFGLAKDLTSELSLTAALEFPLIGTPHYMSPEQIKNEAVTLQADLYAIGVVLFELMRGYPPFAITSLKLPSELTILPASLRLSWLHLNSMPPSLDYHRILNHLISACLAKDVKDRPKSASFLAQELQDWLVNHPTLAQTSLPIHFPLNELQTKKLEHISNLSMEFKRETTKQVHSIRSTTELLLTERAPSARVEKNQEQGAISKSNSSRKVDSYLRSISQENFLLKRNKSHVALGLPLLCVAFIVIWGILYIDISPLPEDKPIKLENPHHLPSLFSQPIDIVQILSREADYLGRQLPPEWKEVDIKESLESLSQTKQIDSDSKLPLLYQAYLSTWLVHPNGAKSALLYLSKQDTQEIRSSFHWYLYALTLLRIQLSNSVSSRFNLAIKAFSKADSYLMKQRVITEQNMETLRVRLKVYQQNNLWKAISIILEHIQTKQELPQDLQELLFEAKQQLLAD